MFPVLTLCMFSVSGTNRPDGCVVPVGKGVSTGVKNPTGYTLNYNEFIVYKTSQIRMKYLVKVQFKFK